MKKILCYGDSNTWGLIPGTQNRFPQNVRWTGLDGAVLMLGTNDCKSYYKADASQIAKGLCKIPIDFSLANSFSRFYNYFIHTIRLQQINRIPHFARQSHANIRYRTSYSVNLTNRG